jgi:hypothetical protein
LQAQLVKELKADGDLLFQMQLARELHMTLGQLRERMTQEEMVLWGIYFEVQAEEDRKQQNKAAMKRR